ncbi:MAG: Radical domain protein [Candidatus Solibacter sp.]|nr:Radical domain protein [Candidatus Solibacter sp.]
MIHPKRSRAKVLLTSVFGPYAQDDAFGSRAINPMELYHNQVTRGQGSFSLRRFHRSWGILMIQENISAACAVLDFPTRETFARELTAHQYDIVGISSIIVNVAKAQEMCRMVRELSPGSTIVIGGHVAAIPGVETMIDADHIVKGDGIAWMRSFLGEVVDAPIRHPDLSSGFDLRVMGVKIPDTTDTAATIISSVGCPMGCNFCTTSAFFGGKGKMLNFYSTGQELFDLMERVERTRHTRAFFIMDENFLLQKKRVMELLVLMKAAGKSWSFNIFSSANAIAKYTCEELVEIGIASIWLGLESPRSNYSKLEGTDTLKLTRELREHGIVLLGSTIIGLEHHTPANIDEEIEFAVSHETDLHQFMLYTPVPGTPLYHEMAGQGRLLDVNLADIHGQHAFNFEHAAISREQSTRSLAHAFERDFERNGPSLFRICRTTFAGWMRYKNHPDPRIRARFERDAKVLRHAWVGMLQGMEYRLRDSNAAVALQIRALRKEMQREFGLIAIAAAKLLGPVLWWTSLREEKRLAQGHSYEPATIIDRRNWPAADSLMPTPLSVEALAGDERLLRART